MSAREVISDWIMEARVEQRTGESIYDQADAIIAALTAAGYVIVRAHKWFLPPGIEYECCKDCGIVRRGDDRHRPCIGPVRVGLRHHEPLKEEYTEGAATNQRDAT